MSVYPIEISEKLKLRLEKSPSGTASPQPIDVTEQKSTNEVENRWIEAVVAIERGDKESAYHQLSKIVSESPTCLDTAVKSDSFDQLELVVIACHAELILLKPINVLADKKRISLLTKISQQLPEQRLKARLSHAIAIVMLWRRDNKQALEHLLQARKVYSELEETLGEAVVADTLGNVFNSLADHQQALLYYSESLALKMQLGDQKGKAITLGNLARLCLKLGRYEQAEKFAKLDLSLCEHEPANTKARIINLLARINLASGQWQTAEDYLQKAIELHDESDMEGIFFCHKDLILLKIQQGKTISAEELIPLQQYLSTLSPFHQLHYDILARKAELISGNFDINRAEKTLADIQSKNLPEVEIEYRIWLSQAAFSQQHIPFAKTHLLLARKLARKYGFKCFTKELSSLMHQYDIHESIAEETQRPIVESIEQVGDGYLIRQKLGSGGFGNVYQAHDMVSDRDVALKQFHIQDQWDQSEFQTLWNQARIEFEAVGSIKHPAIAKTYALGHDNFGTPYLVQELLTGGELRSLMGSSQKLDQVLTYLIPIVQGLAVIHQAGVIHRDLKPENILLNTQGMPVIVDFGIALLKQQPSENGRICGTLDYMAPEQSKSIDIDHRADLYSLGCILFEWLSGQTPKASFSQKGRIAEWLTSGPKYDISKEVFGEATALLRSLLHKNPAKRPKDALQLLEKLKALKENSLN